MSLNMATKDSSDSAINGTQGASTDTHKWTPDGSTSPPNRTPGGSTNKPNITRGRNTNTQTSGIVFGYKELFLDLHVNDIYPLDSFVDVVKRLRTLRGPITLDFSGIEQVTDAVLCALAQHAGEAAPNIKRVLLVGCVHLTDRGIQFLLSVLTNLKELYLDGCQLITEACLTQGQLGLEVLSMVGTSVANLPKDLSVPKLYLGGCPLYSPWTPPLQGPGQMPLEGPDTRVPINTYKLVVLGTEEGELDSTGSTLQYLQDASSPHKELSEVKFNIFRCNGSDAFCSPFITEGSLYIIGVSISDSTSTADITQKVASRINLLRGNELECSVTVVGYCNADLTDAANIQWEEIKTSISGVLKQRFCFKPPELSLLSHDERFHSQRTYAIDMISSQCVEKVDFHLIKNTKDQEPVKDNPVFPANLQCLQKMINNIPERSHVGAEFLKISEDLKRIRDKKILPLESLNNILQLRIAPLTKALEKLTKMGSILFYPKLPSQPVVLDIAWFINLLVCLRSCTSNHNGHQVVSLPMKTPLFGSRELVDTIWKSKASNVQVPFLMDILRSLGLVLTTQYPRHSPQDPATKMFSTFHIPHTPDEVLRENKGIIKDFMQEYWQVVAKAEVRRDILYKFGGMMPDSLWGQIIGECYRMGQVTSCSTKCVLFHHSAVEMCLLKQNKPATLCSELRLVAYLLPQPQSVVVKKSEYINNDHIAAAMSPFMLAIEYLTAQHQYLHMQITIPCKNRSCNGVLTTTDFRTSLGFSPKCPVCKEEMTSLETPRISQPSLPLHDWSDREKVVCGMCQQCRTGGEVCPHWNTSPADACSCLHSGINCSHCGICRPCVASLWKMECAMRPSFICSSLQTQETDDQDNFSIHGNIISVSGHQQCLALPHHMCVTEIQQLDITILKPGPGILCLTTDSNSVLTGSKEAWLPDMREAVCIDLCTGQVSKHEADCGEEILAKLGRTAVVGDHWSFRVTKERLDLVDEIEIPVEDIEVSCNQQIVTTVAVPSTTSVALLLGSAKESGSVILLLDCPSCPIIRAHNFPLGVAVLVRGEDDSEGCVGRVEAIEKGRLRIRTADDPAGKILPPDSPQLLPLCKPGGAMAITAISDTANSAETVVTDERLYQCLTKQMAPPVPHGLVPRELDKKLAPLPIYGRTSLSCTSGCFSPLVLNHTYKRWLKENLRSARVSLYGIFLPPQFSTVMLFHNGGPAVSDWSEIDLHFLCKGNILSGRKYVQDPHFIDEEPVAIGNREEEVKFLQYFLHDLLVSCGLITTTKGMVLTSWNKSMPGVRSDLPMEDVLRGLIRWTKQYQSVLLLHSIMLGDFQRLVPVQFMNKKLKPLKKQVMGSLNKILSAAKASKELPGNKFRCSIHRAVSIKKSVCHLTVESAGAYRECVQVLDLNGVVLSSTYLPAKLLALFPNLHFLNVIGCGLSSLEGIGNVPSLRVLHAQNNAIRELPADFIQLKDSLMNLNISGNPIRELPDYIADFLSLTSLVIANTLIKELPARIGTIPFLKSLDCHHTLLTKVPDSIKHLKYLDNLTVTGVPYVLDLESGKAAKITTSVMSLDNFNAWLNNGIWNIPFSTLDNTKREALFRSCDSNNAGLLTDDELPKLEEKLFHLFPRLGKQNDELGGFPRPVLSCRLLTRLRLSHQAIRHIPDAIGRLNRLTTVVFSSNKYLETVSGELGKAPLTNISLDKCPNLYTPPAEIVAQGTQPVIAYLKRMSLGSQACYRTKLMFVGLGGAGKTSLMRALMSNEFKSAGETGESITDGIDINNWSINRQGVALTFGVWDFAGQTLYYNTHQFFLSDRAVYFLIWNTRLGHEHAGLDFWLSSIACHAPRTPIFVVATHADQVSKSDMPMEQMKKRYPNIVAFKTVSSYTGEGIENLLEELIEVTLKQPYIGERIPQAWLNLEHAIISLRGAHSVLSWKTICELAENHGIYGTEVNQAVSFIHNLGTLQHFDNDFLKDQVVINPQWIVDVMACMVSVHNTAIKNGRLKHVDTAVIWKDYPSELHDWLLHLTEAFDLTFPLQDEPVNIVPCLLPQKEPKMQMSLFKENFEHERVEAKICQELLFEWPDVHSQHQGSQENKILYQFGYLPAGLFNRAQVRLYQFSDSSALWKSGSLLRKNGHLALITQLDNSQVLVRVQGLRPDNILLMVHEVFEALISESFQGVHYDFMLPCSDCNKMETKEPTMFTSKTLRKAIEMRALFLQCHTFFHMLPISQVQSIMPPDSTTEYDLHLQNAVRDMEDLKDDLSSDAFFLFCPANVPSEEEMDNIVHPKTIKEDLEKKHFKCGYHSDVLSLDVTDIVMGMKQSQMILVFISNDFVKNGQCQRLFQLIQSLHKPYLLLMVGQGREWQTSDIGMQVTEQVFINFQRMEQYEAKLQELVVKLHQKIGKRIKSMVPKDVFISYCWVNSGSAVEAGHTREKPGSLGYGDPRAIKSFLESKGISCWLDIDNVGTTGLFEDIAEGLKQSKIVLACVSDEYSLSTNCQMEFRFAHVTLKMPIVLAVVGTGFKWESTEIGMLSLGHPKINLQVANEVAHKLLLLSIKERLVQVAEEEEKKEKKEEKRNVPSPEVNQTQNAFQELYELAQRKFQRQINGFSSENMPYPRLYVVDIMGDSQSDNSQEANPEDVSIMEGLNFDFDDDGDKEEQDGSMSDKTNTVPGNVPDIKTTEFCFKILCEHEGGWHACDQGLPIPLVGGQLSSLWRLLAPYLARIMAILKHSNTNLNILYDNTGLLDNLMLKFEQHVGTENVKDVYQMMQNFIIRADKEQTRGNLSRCHLPSGKTLWLCPEHQKLPRITVFSNESFPVDEAGLLNQEYELLDIINSPERAGPNGNHSQSSAVEQESASKEDAPMLEPGTGPGGSHDDSMADSAGLEDTPPGPHIKLRTLGKILAQGHKLSPAPKSQACAIL